MKKCLCSHLYVIVSVVVNIEDPVELGVLVDLEVLFRLDALAQGLASILLHLNVIELPEKEKKAIQLKHKIKLQHIANAVWNKHMMQFRNTFAHTTLEIGPLRYVPPQKSVVESLSQNI